MDIFVSVVNDIFKFMRTRWTFGKYQFSYWDIIIFTVICGSAFWIVSRILDTDN